jgi:hypothetical protein
VQDPIPLTDAWSIINTADWSDTSYADDKAYLLVLFSECAYYAIPDFELRERSRIKVIPCFAYQDLVSAAHRPEIESRLRSADFGDFFVITRRYAVVVGVRTPKVTVVAIRGTKYLYDWFTNLHAVTQRVPGQAADVALHRGFMLAMLSCFPPLAGHLRKSPWPDAPIYVTGHSLGGGLAAIMHALWGMPTLAYFGPASFMEQRMPTHSCYTFGMPRYGSAGAVLSLRGPYHLYNPGDIVPTVPPRWMGFENCIDEYVIEDRRIVESPGREGSGFRRWIWRLFSGSGIRDHAIEKYRGAIRDIVHSGKHP